MDKRARLRKERKKKKKGKSRIWTLVVRGQPLELIDPSPFFNPSDLGTSDLSPHESDDVPKPPA